MRRESMERIADRTISETDLRSEIEGLEEITERPSFWADLANDPGYPAGRRALFICELVKRHLRTPMPIGALAELLGHPDWIGAETVTHVAHLKGEIPVEWNVGETVLAIHLFPGETEPPRVLYLRLSGHLDVKEFVEMMKAPRLGAARTGIGILEAACSG